MEHYGYGEETFMDNYDLINQIIHTFHPQFKYLVLHGVVILLKVTQHILQEHTLKLMVHYGHGDMVHMENWHKII